MKNFREEYRKKLIREVYAICFVLEVVGTEGKKKLADNLTQKIAENMILFIVNSSKEDPTYQILIRTVLDVTIYEFLEDWIKDIEISENAITEECDLLSHIVRVTDTEFIKTSKYIVINEIFENSENSEIGEIGEKLPINIKFPEILKQAALMCIEKCKLNISANDNC